MSPRRDTPSVGTATRPSLSLSLPPDRAMAALLPPPLARASAALGRTLMPVAEGGAFKLLLLDTREALIIMHTFEVPGLALKYIDGVWTYRPH